MTQWSNLMGSAMYPPPSASLYHPHPLPDRKLRVNESCAKAAVPREKPRGPHDLERKRY